MKSNTLTTYLLLLFIATACNIPETNSGQANQKQPTQSNTKQRITTVAGTQISADSLKPPIVKQAGKPQIIQIPTKPGTSYTKHLKDGNKKIDLLPPVIKLLPIVVTDLQPLTTSPSKDQSPAAIGNFTTFTTDQGLALDGIACGFRDKSGNLWFGTYGGGVSRYEGKSFTTFTTQQGLAHNTILSITEDKSGNLWFGTNGGGVSRYDGKSFTTFTTQQGLAHNTISSITEDKNGNLWFGTDGGGVSRYDPSIPISAGSKSFTSFTTQQGLAHNNVRSITEDKNGNLWFGTLGGGVSCYEGSRANHPCNKNTCKHDLRIQQDLKEHTNELAKSFTTFTTQQGLANNTIWSITEDKSGNLWFGTNGGGVSRYDGNRVEEIEAALQRGETIPQRTQQDLKKINGKLVKSFTTFTTQQGLANNTIWNITEDKSGNLWFGTDRGGVSRYDGKSFTTFTTQQGLAHNNVRSITEDKSGNLWFGTYGGGVSRYGGKSVTIFTTQQGLAHNNVRSITEDKCGNLWFGTDEGGVSRYDGKSFTTFTTQQGLAHNTIWSITEDKKGNLWFGTDRGGVSRYDGKSFTTFTTQQGLAHNNVRSITEDKSGNLWFGTDGGGVSRYDGNRVEAIEAALQRGEIIPQRTQQDLKKINGKLVKSFTTFTTQQGLAQNNVKSITEDKNGNLWFGTNGGGVSRYDPSTEPVLSGVEGISAGSKSFTTFTTQQGLAHNTILSITKDKSGNLWFGTDGGGVSHYDGNRVEAIEAALQRGEIIPQRTQQDLKKINGKLVKSFTTFTTQQGLADRVVYGIIESLALPSQREGEESGFMVFGTNLGLSLFYGWKNQNGQLIPYNASIPSGVPGYEPVWEIYNNKTGYPIKDLNTNAMCITKVGLPYGDKSDVGIIWGGCGNDKVIRFDPKAVNKNTQPPSLFIQSVKLNNENICWYNLAGSREFEVRRQEENALRNAAKTAAPSEVKFLNPDSAMNAQQEVMTYGKLLSNEVRDSVRKKFSDIQFDGITKFYPLPENLVLPYKHNSISFDFVAIETGRNFLVRYQYILEGYDKEWSPLTEKTSATFGNIYEGTYTFKLKARSPEGVWSDLVIYTFKVLPPWQRIWWAYLIYLLIGSFVIWLVYRWRVVALLKEKKLLEDTVKVRTYELAEKTIVAEQQKEIAEAQREVATAQKHIIEEKQKEILDSIHYASRIQQALLTGEEYIKEHLSQGASDYFILFKPKDIVAGDFYWAYFKEGTLEKWTRGDGTSPDTRPSSLFYIATCDCTGHGVPGAFMSMLNINFLNENVIERGIKMPDELLNTQRSEIIKALNPKGNENSKDGMDCVLCAFDFEKMLLHFAAANNPLWLVRKGELIEYKADKMPVGKYTEEMHPFTLQTIELQKGDVIYTATDGFADQFGATNGKKLMKKPFKEELLKIHLQPMSEQKKYLNQFFENWKGNTEQIDDVCIIGIRI